VPIYSLVMATHTKATLTETLREKIRESGLTYGEVSRRSGIQREVISRFMNRRAGMGLGTLDRLVAAMDLQLVEADEAKRKTRRKAGG